MTERQAIRERLADWITEIAGEIGWPESSDHAYSLYASCPEERVEGYPELDAVSENDFAVALRLAILR